MKAFAITDKKLIQEIEIDEPIMESNEILLEVHYIGCAEAI
jgi:hypothetical protein